MKYDLTAILSFTFAALLIYTSCMAPRKENMATLSMAEIKPGVMEDVSKPVEFKEKMSPAELTNATTKLTALDDILRGACKKYKYFPSV